MPRQSTIRRLTQAQKDAIHRMLDSGATLDEILAELESMGADVSRSSLGRYKQQVDKVAARLRESREMADAIVSRMGPDATEGEQGRFLVQMLTTITGDYLLRQMEDDAEGLGSDEIKNLARALRDTATASRLSQDYELKIREEARKEAAKAAVAAVESVAKEGGMSADTVKSIKSRILGVGNN